MQCHTLLWLLMYVLSPHTLLLHNTSGSFLFALIVEQRMCNLCYTLQTFHILDTLRHLRELASCTNCLPTVGSLQSK